MLEIFCTHPSSAKINLSLLSTHWRYWWLFSELWLYFPHPYSSWRCTKIGAEISPPKQPPIVQSQLRMPSFDSNLLILLPLKLALPQLNIFALPVTLIFFQSSSKPYDGVIIAYEMIPFTWCGSFSRTTSNLFCFHSLDQSKFLSLNFFYSFSLFSTTFSPHSSAKSVYISSHGTSKLSGHQP